MDGGFGDDFAVEVVNFWLVALSVEVGAEGEIRIYLVLKVLLLLFDF